MKHFRISEFDSPDAPGSGANMNVYFLSLLDAARDLCGFSWKVSAGFRTKTHNKKIGGAAKSYHLTGEAADIACRNSQQRYAIVAAAIKVGIKGIEVCDGHIHLDNRDSPTLWSDKSK